MSAIEQYIVASFSITGERLASRSLQHDPAEDRWALGAPLNNLEQAFYGHLVPQTGQFYLLLNTDGLFVRLHVNAEGHAVETGRWSAEGGEPSYIASDGSGRYLAIANSRGGFAIFRNGETPRLIANLRTTGSGPHRRQPGPHPHWTQFSPDNRFIYGCELGGDKVLAYRFNADTGEVGEEIVAFETLPGAGPRHMLFHKGGTHVFVLNELDSTVLVLALNADGILTLRQRLSSLPETYSGDNEAAHITSDPAGRLLYVSNRGHDSICVFSIGPDALLAPLQWAPSGGGWPWFFFNPDPTRMLVTNWAGNALTFFDIKPDGTLTQGASLSVPQPVFVAKLPRG